MGVQILPYYLLYEPSKVQYPGSFLFFFLNLFLISPIILNIPGLSLEEGGKTSNLLPVPTHLVCFVLVSFFFLSKT